MSVGQRKVGYCCLSAQNQQTTTHLPVPPDLTAVSVLEMTHFVTLAPVGYSFPFDCLFITFANGFVHSLQAAKKFTQKEI